jgi:PAS domain S-box-containing protein
VVLLSKAETLARVVRVVAQTRANRSRSITPGRAALDRYAFACLLTVLSLAIALLGRTIWADSGTYSLLLGAVMPSSWICGLGPGIVATILGTAAVDFLLIEPINTISVDASRLVQLSAFMGIAALISSLNAFRRRAIGALADERTTLEQRVEERTAQLRQANAELTEEMGRRSRSDRHFRRLIESAPDAILVVDGDGRIIEANHETERLFGYPRMALLGSNAEIVVPQRFRDAIGRRRADHQQQPGNGTISGESIGRRADGTEFPVEIRISALDGDESGAVIGIVRDVSDRDIRSCGVSARRLTRSPCPQPH